MWISFPKPPNRKIKLGQANVFEMKLKNKGKCCKDEKRCFIEEPEYIKYTNYYNGVIESNFGL